MRPALSLWPVPLWQLWLVCALVIGIGAMLTTGSQPHDPDDYMRYLQVRDWLGGQGWYDTRQYRFDPPYGADMHWTRIVDLPIAAAMALFDLFLPTSWSDRLTLTIIPLAQLFIAMALIRALLNRLGRPKAGVVGAGLLLLFPFCVAIFSPARIDHHGWQAIAALTVAWLMVRGGRAPALAAGTMAALWLMISLEGFPLAAAFGALFALRYILFARHEHEAYLAGLAAGGTALMMIFRAPDTWSQPLCDVLSWPHIAAFAAGAVIARASRYAPLQGDWRGRALSLVPICLVGAPLVIMPLGMCAISPLYDLDPYLKANWLANIAEANPIWRQEPPAAAMLVWTAMLPLAAVVLVLRNERAKREEWLLLAAAATVANLIAFTTLRAGLIGQVLTIPFATVLLLHLLPKARALTSTIPRILATVASIWVCTPLLAPVALSLFDRPDPPDQMGATAGVAATTGSRRCDFGRLADWPRAHIFTTLDRGPELLALTPHTAVMSGYHRNQRKIFETMQAFGGDYANAREIVLANGADYVVACLTAADFQVASRGDGDTLARRIKMGDTPSWLTPVPGFEAGALRAFRVRYPAD
ncbi:hypothetical protein [Alteriqipengyuania sp. 357]